jgi:hypothetical protein
MGSCRDGSTCHYSHEKSILQTAYDRRLFELSSSPFAKTHRAAYSSDSCPNPTWKPQASFTPSPFSPSNKTPARPLREIYEDKPTTPPPEDESDRVHRSGNNTSSTTLLLEPPTQVSILNRNVV